VSDIAIRVENLGKLYHIGRAQGGAGYRTLRESVMDWAKIPRHWFGRNGHNVDDETIWALKNVSFEVKQGEVVGIIGRNGAGKSTLLKILSRITEPTHGTLDLYGRVGSLLEVGSGFHPELTGRENIYLNGAILGMKKTEIERKFNEIVDFAEIDKFLDTPVKRYSSGMYVRLAFAVAAHLEPEILMVDEVLAVGDAQFQKKCLGKMSDVAKEGRTVLFVSHNLATITQLCARTILFERGKILEDGNSYAVVSKYYQGNTTSSPDVNLLHHVGSGKAHFVSVQILDDHGRASKVFSMGESLFVDMEVLSEVITGLQFSIEIIDQFGKTIIHAVNQDDHFEARSIAGRYHVQTKLPNIQLYPGRYILGVWCGYIMEDYDYIREYTYFNVEQGIVSGRTSIMKEGQAVFFAPTQWENL